MSTKSFFLVIICNLTHLQDGNTKIKFMLRMLEKIHVLSETNWKVGSGSEKVYSGSTILRGIKHDGTTPSKVEQKKTQLSLSWDYFFMTLTQLHYKECFVLYEPILNLSDMFIFCSTQVDIACVLALGTSQQCILSLFCTTWAFTR